MKKPIRTIPYTFGLIRVLRIVENNGCDRLFTYFIYPVRVTQ